MFTKLFKHKEREAQLQTEKARLEAFLAAFPGEYCGWADGGDILYSKGFSGLLGVSRIETLSDIQTALEPGDAAALESFFSRLKSSGQGFSVSVGRFGSEGKEKTLRISGTRGKSLSGTNRFDILWLEDISEEAAARSLFIRESEEKDAELETLQTLLDSIPRPIWIRDAKQRLFWCNQTYADFLSVSKDEVYRDQREIFGQVRRHQPPAGGEAMLPPGKPLARKALELNEAVETRTHCVVNGQRVLMNISVRPLKGEVFKDQSMTMGIAYNVTREEELEVKLQRYETSNRELLEQLRSAIAIYEGDQTLAFYNVAFTQLWGLEEKWLNRKPTLGEVMEKLREIRSLPEQANFKSFKQKWTDMFTDLIGAYEDLLHLPDGKTLRMLVVPHSAGGLMMTFEDVTQNLALESSYKTLVAVQKETLDNLAEAVAVFGGDGRLRLSNPAYSRLWKLNPEDIEGDPHISRLVERMKPFFTAKEWAERRETLLSKGLDRGMHEGRMTRVDESLIEYTTVPLPDGGVLVTYDDITDSVRVENALREKNAALEEAERLKLDFLANVSYQLRTPLNAIMGFNDILDQEFFGPLNIRQKEYTKDIKSASTRLLNLVNDILDLSTLEAGYMSLDITDTKIYKMLKGVEDLVGEWARKENIELVLKCPKNIGTLPIDERRVQQAIISLIRNAIAYTSSGGEIIVSAKKEEKGISFIVSDDGVGISQENLQRIFKPFERIKAPSGEVKTPDAAPGAGLGLSLVKNIIALHGGSVNIESEKGEGTTVSFFLPNTVGKSDVSKATQQN